MPSLSTITNRQQLSVRCTIIFIYFLSSDFSFILSFQIESTVKVNQHTYDPDMTHHDLYLVVRQQDYTHTNGTPVIFNNGKRISTFRQQILISQLGSVPYNKKHREMDLVRFDSQSTIQKVSLAGTYPPCWPGNVMDVPTCS